MAQGESKIHGKITRSNVVVLEVFSVDITDEATRLQFSKNPENVLRSLIQQEGVKINDLKMLSRAEMNAFERNLFGSNAQTAAAAPSNGTTEMRNQYHIVWPETSAWICCCA